MKVVASNTQNTLRLSQGAREVPVGAWLSSDKEDVFTVAASACMVIAAHVPRIHRGYLAHLATPLDTNGLEGLNNLIKCVQHEAMEVSLPHEVTLWLGGLVGIGTLNIPGYSEKDKNNYNRLILEQRQHANEVISDCLPEATVVNQMSPPDSHLYAVRLNPVFGSLAYIEEQLPKNLL